MFRLSAVRQKIAYAVIFAFAAFGPAGAAEKVSIAATQTGFLVWLAAERGYFADEGVDVEIRSYQSGSFAADALVNDEVVLSTTSDSAFVSRSIIHDDLRAIAVLSASETARLVGRKDRGIEGAEDLIGKRVGVTRKSSGEFFLSRYLSLNGISPDEMEIVDLGPGDISDQLVNGDIDAGLTWDPYMYAAETRLGAEGVMLPDQDGQFFYFLLLGKAAWIEENPETARAVLRALLRAEEFSLDEPVSAAALISDRFDYDPDYLQHIWPLHNLRIGLPQDLLFLMEEQSKWQIREGLTDRTDVPNFLDFIASALLDAVKPSTVGIVQ